MLHSMMHRFRFATALGICLLGFSNAARAVVVVNDTWKDGTDSDPAPGDADFDDVGGVNGQDFLIWQRGLGLTGTGTNATGDADANTNVNAADLTLWRSQFGTTPSGGFSENGVDSDGDGDVESVWFQGGTGSLNPAGLNGPLVMNTHTATDPVGTPSTGSASWTTYFKPAGQNVVLAAAGDALKITWQFTLTGVNAGNTSQNFRFAVVDTTTRTLTNGSLAPSVYSGYAIIGNMGPVLGNGNPFQLRERSNMAVTTLLDTSGNFTSLVNGALNGSEGYVANTPYTMTWLMTRGATDNLLLDVSITGGTLGDVAGEMDNDATIRATFDDPTPFNFQFDTFAMRPSGESTTATEFRTSLFKVETLSGQPVIAAVPEPSAIVGGVTALVALAGARRRRA